MVFGWLFGEKEKDREKDKAAEAAKPDVGALLQEATRATQSRNAERGESLCREVLKVAPDNPDAWTMLGVNLIRRGISDPELRAEAVLAWSRVLVLRPDDVRAREHLTVEAQFPDELVPKLVKRLAEPGPLADDAATALSRIGSKARQALENTASSAGPAADRARSLLGAMA